MSKSCEKGAGARGRRNPRFPASATGCAVTRGTEPACLLRRDPPSETKEAPKPGGLRSCGTLYSRGRGSRGRLGGRSTFVRGQCSPSPGAGPHSHGASLPASGRGANPGPGRISTRKVAKAGAQPDGLLLGAAGSQAGSCRQSAQNTVEEERVSWTRERVHFKGAELETFLAVQPPMPERRWRGRGRHQRRSSGLTHR